MNEIVRSPEVIAAEIESIKVQTRNVILQSSVEIGRRLVEAKELVPHGEWEQWLDKTVDYSQSTAINLMKVYKEYGSNSQTFGNLSYSKAVALLGVPKEERQDFVEENNVEDMSTRELKKVIKQKQQIEKELQKSKEEAETGKKAQAEVSRLKKQLKEAKANDRSKEVNELNIKIQKLEDELKKKPIDVPAIPEEVENELEELRNMAKQPKSEKTAKFKVQFETLTSGFKNLLQSLEDVKNEDAKAFEAYREAVLKLTTEMKKRLIQ